MTGGPHRGFLLAVLALSGYATSMDKLFGGGQIQQALFLLLLPLNEQTYPPSSLGYCYSFRSASTVQTRLHYLIKASIEWYKSAAPSLQWGCEMVE